MAGFFLARLPRYPQPDDGVSKTALPAVAAAASWMEAMKMPMRKVYEIYTKSEMAIQGWRSSEIAASMHERYQHRTSDAADNALYTGNPMPSDAELALERRFGPDLVAKLDEDMDFRKLTGDEVVRYMGAMGINIGGRMIIPTQLPTMEEATRGLR